MGEGGDENMGNNTTISFRFRIHFSVSPVVSHEGTAKSHNNVLSRT